MTLYGYTKSAPQASATTLVYPRSCDVGNTLVMGVLHHATGSTLTVADNSGGVNVWNKIQSTNDLGATAQRNVDLWWCKPTVAITSITITASASCFLLASAEDLAGNAWTVRNSNKYFDSTRVCPPITTVAGDALFFWGGYNATTGGTTQISSMAGWTYEGENNYGTTQIEQWKIPTSASITGSQTVNPSGSPTLGAVYVAFSPTAAPANAVPTITGGATVTMTSGTTATITYSGNDSDGTIASFQTTTVVSTAATPPTVGTPSYSNLGSANASVSFPVTGLSPGDHLFTDTDTDNAGGVSAPGTTRIIYTALAPARKAVTLNGVTMTTPASGTAVAALNNQATVPVVFTTASPPAAGATLVEDFQPLDTASVPPYFGQWWAASDNVTPITVYVDLKFSGVTKATASATLTSTTPVFVGRNCTDVENASIGSGQLSRVAPTIAARFS